MIDSYLTVATPSEVELEEKRSRFVARLERADDEISALDAVDNARRRHAGAGHHSFGFILGPAGERKRFSDDGEPGGTAGMPILVSLEGRGLSDVVAVVSRWFGGTLLGAGGLARVYGEAVRRAVDEAKLCRRVRVERVWVDVDHGSAGRLANRLRSRGFAIAGAEYSDIATLIIDVILAREAEFAQLIGAMSEGEARVARRVMHWTDVDV